MCAPPHAGASSAASNRPDPQLSSDWFVCLDAKDENAQSGGSHG